MVLEPLAKIDLEVKEANEVAEAGEVVNHEDEDGVVEIDEEEGEVVELDPKIMPLPLPLLLILLHPPSLQQRRRGEFLIALHNQMLNLKRPLNGEPPPRPWPWSPHQLRLLLPPFPWLVCSNPQKRR
jgi:hypothetical protein